MKIEISDGTQRQVVDRKALAYENLLKLLGEESMVKFTYQGREYEVYKVYEDGDVITHKVDGYTVHVKHTSMFDGVPRKSTVIVEKDIQYDAL